MLSFPESQGSVYGVEVKHFVFNCSLSSTSQGISTHKNEGEGLADDFSPSRSWLQHTCNMMELAAKQLAIQRNWQTAPQPQLQLTLDNMP